VNNAEKNIQVENQIASIAVKNVNKNIGNLKERNIIVIIAGKR
jgi:hypothetical protein